MEQRSIKILKLMEAIQERPKQSQRELAKTLDLSLGLVNKFIKDLTAQGILETTNYLKRRVEYILTPKGVEEKDKLKMQHVTHSIELYKNIKGMIGEKLTELNGGGENNLVFYGAGDLCEIACVLLNNNNHREITVIDDKKAGTYICGNKIYKEEEIYNMVYDILIITKFENKNSIINKLVANGVSSDKIFTIY